MDPRRRTLRGSIRNVQASALSAAFPAERKNTSGNRCGLAIRRKRDSRIGAEPGREMPLGTNGTIRQKGDAVPQRRPIRSERGGWKGDLLRQSTVILNRIEFEALLSFAHGLQPNFPCLL